MKRVIGYCSVLLLASVAALRAEERKTIRVVVWDEQQPQQKQAYPDFLGNSIADSLRKNPRLEVKSVRLDDPDQGLSDATLNSCDVLIWWGHVRQQEVQDTRVEMILDRVLQGKTALIALHSAHWSKPFVKAMETRAREDVLTRRVKGELAFDELETVTPPRYVAPKRDSPLTPSVTVRETNGKKVATLTLPNCCFPAYRADGKPSHVHVLKPDHPVARGIPATFDIPAEEMYDEPFHVPQADESVFEERWDGGEHFRSGSVWNLGKGRVFYFRPGHETYPIYRQPETLKVVENAVLWLGGR